jgi:hypothetical protein
MTVSDVPDKDWDGWKENLEPYYDLDAGDGEYLVLVYKRKLQNWNGCLEALTTIFGIDPSKGNVEKIKKRLLHFVPKDMQELAREIVDVNIFCSKTEDWNVDEWCPVSETRKAKIESTGWFESE